MTHPESRKPTTPTWCKRLLVPAMMAGSLVAASAQAGNNAYSPSYTDHSGYTVETAKVTQVQPVYESVRIETPRRECRTEQVERRVEQPYRDHYQARGSITPEIIGAVIGAGIGHKFGHGRGKRLGTVAGAVLGASVGNDIKRHNRRHQDRYDHRHTASTRSYVEHVEVCEDVTNYHEEQRVVGYRVQYRYNGRDYWTETDRDPGDRIEVRVSVSPISS